MVNHTQLVLLQFQKLSTNMANIGSYTKSYLISNDKSLLIRIHRADSTIKDHIDTVKKITANNPLQQKNIDSLWQDLHMLLDVCSKLTSKPFEGLNEIITNENKHLDTLTIRIRRQIHNIELTENELLSLETESYKEKSSAHFKILITIVGLTLLILAFFLQKIRNDFQMKKKREALLTQLNDELEEKVWDRTSELLKSKNALEKTMLRITDAFIALDKDWKYTYVNKSAASLVKMKQEEMIGKNVWELFPQAVGSSTYNAFQQAMQSQHYVNNFDYYAPLDLWQENHIYPSPEGITVYIRDVSESKKAEANMLKVNRLYFFISQVNQMIVRTTDEETLFKKACRIAVELGEFRMAWIGMIDETSRKVIPVMYAGEEKEYLTKVKIITIEDIEQGRGITGKAMKEGRYVISNDIETDPQMEPWKEESLERGYKSCMSVPIIKFNKVVGAFNFYADVKHFFDQSEIDLLQEATGDMAYALENLEKERQRKKAEEAIIVSNDRFEMLAQATNDVIWDWDLVNNKFWWNNNFYTHFGYTPDHTSPDLTTWRKGIHPEDRERIINGIQEAILSGKKSWSDEYRYLKQDGEIMHMFDRGYIIHSAEGKAYRMIGSVEDLTAYKKVMEDLIKEKNLSDSIINSLPGIFYLYDKTGKFLRWNKNFETVSEYSHDEVNRMHPLDFFAENEKTLLAEKIGNVFIAGEDNVQANFLTKSGRTIPYYFTGIVIDFENEPCLMGVGIDFSEKVKAHEDLRQTTGKLQQLTTHLLQIREEERKRIGREIHDELGQQLTAIKMDITWIDKKIPEEAEALKTKLRNVIQLLDGSNSSIRRILSELRPSILDEHGLPEALSWLSRRFSENTGIPAIFTSNIPRLKLSEAVNTCVYRIYQEALTNITRYAEATKVTAILTLNENLLHFEVEDNGTGFDLNAQTPKKSFGLLGIKERAGSVGGNFHLISEPGAGTKIIIEIPITP